MDWRCDSARVAGRHSAHGAVVVPLVLVALLLGAGCGGDAGFSAYGFDVTVLGDGSGGDTHGSADLDDDLDGAGVDDGPADTVGDAPTPDTSAPTIRFDEPVDGAELSGAEVAMSVTAEDDQGVVSVAFFADGVGIGVDTDAPFEATWDTTGFAPGSFVLAAEAADAAGNIGVAAIDVSYLGSCSGGDCPPTVRITAPDNGTHVRGRVPVTVAVADDEGVTGVKFLVDGGLIADDTSVPFSIDWDTDEFDEGVHAVKAIATDLGGQTAAAEIVVTVDRTPPTVTVESPQGESFENVVALEATVGDDLGVDRVEWYVGDPDFALEIDEDTGEVVYLVGTPVSVLDAAPFWGEFDASSLDSGGRWIVAVAYDRVGLAGSASGSFRLDRSPIVAITAPTEGSTVAGTGDVRIELADDSTRVDLTLSVDGVAVDSTVETASGAGIHRGVELSWTPAYVRGARTLRVDALDSAGRTGGDTVTVLVDHPYELSVDLCDPTCAALAGGEVVVDTVSVEAATRDDDGTTTRVEFFVDGALGVVAVAAPWTWEWDTTETLDGNRVVRVVATSSNGNTAEVTRTVRANNCDRDDDTFRSLACGGPDCDDVDPSYVSNLCGGCMVLGGAIGEPCAGCADGGALACALDNESLICVSELTNACGGCAELEAAPDSPCGPCGLDAWECRPDGESVVCSSATRNACGGCAELGASPGADCAGCADEGAGCEWACAGTNAVTCDAVPLVVDGFVRIPAGTFVMGSPSGEAGRYSNETQHSVTLSRDFYLQATEVTQEQWQALMGNAPSYFSACGADCPVERVNWWDAVSYANALSASEGLPACYTLTGCSGVGSGCSPGWTYCDVSTCSGVTVNAAGGNPYLCTGYRLPTESEWEYAARAGTTTATYAGNLTDGYCPDTTLPPIAWFCGNAGSSTHVVGDKTANAWGLYDMLGNVWEWTWDWYGTYPGSVTDPHGASSCSERVFRGGSLSSRAYNARAAVRFDGVPDVRHLELGFRLARTAP